MKSKWTNQDLEKLLLIHFGISGSVERLGGDVDFNYKVKALDRLYVLKITPPEINQQFIDFQIKLLEHLGSFSEVNSSNVIRTTDGKPFVLHMFEGEKWIIRVLSWLEGEYWSTVKLKKKSHFTSLGKEVAKIAKSLNTFDHPQAHRPLEWDLSQAHWLEEGLEVHQGAKRGIVKYFYELYEGISPKLKHQRKSVVHNDANENNIMIHNGAVSSLIDYGDAIYTALINDVAIAAAYGAMDVDDPLMAVCLIVKGYHTEYPLLEEEIDLIYGLIGIRLAISVTKSSQAYLKDPKNEYHQISARAAWDLIEKWRQIPETFAIAKIRKACGYLALSQYETICNFLDNNKIDIKDLFKFSGDIKPLHIDLSIDSELLLLPEEYNDPKKMQGMLDEFMVANDVNLLYGGYLESRAFYITDAYRTEGLAGPEYRTIHLGEDYWVPAMTEIYCPIDGIIELIQDNQFYKDYGPTIIVKHETEDGIPFYTLYGHLCRESLSLRAIGEVIKKGELLGRIGKPEVNGSWAPHLHFQIIADLLENKSNFPGVARPSEIEIWKELCPRPGLLINLDDYPPFNSEAFSDVYEKRLQILGPSLSLSYDDPLYIVRGQLQYLFDYAGQKYLDLVNNVPHVGHQHPRVVKALCRQGSILNTNSRYLHPLILEYGQELLNSFPESLEVIYFVNSGSEANELAMRMCRTITERKHIMAIEGGYHGNTQACIDVSSYKFNGKGGRGKPSTTSLMPMPDSLRGLHQGDLSETGLAYASYIDGIINELNEKGDLPAAFIHESILSCGGQLVLPDSYLEKVYEVIRSNGGYCIADEVQTGFGRVGEQFWAFQLQGVIPDVVTMGKPMGNGHPLGAVVCSREIAEKFNNGMEFFSTYGGNPVSCAIGHEVLKIIEEEGLQDHALEMGEYVKNQLKAITKDNSFKVDVRGYGLFLGIEFIKENKPDDVLANSMVQELRKRNILLSTDGPDNNVIKIKPPMCIQKQDLDYFLDQFKSAFIVLKS